MVANGNQLNPLRRGLDRPRGFTCTSDTGARGAPPADGQGAAEGGIRGCTGRGGAPGAGLAQDRVVFFPSARGSEGIIHPTHARSELCICFDGWGNQNED